MSQTAWYATLGVVTTFTGVWFFVLLISISELEIYWDIYMVLSLFSAAWYVYAIKWRHTIMWMHVVMIGLACFAAFLIYVMAMILATLTH